MKVETAKGPKLYPAATALPLVRIEVAVEDIAPDEANRHIAEDDEDFQTLVDSIRVLGVLQPPLVIPLGGGKYRLIDGERRWRAAQRAGLSTIPCDGCPEGTNASVAIAAGVAANEHRKAHGCVHVARRLRALKNQFAESQEQLAARTGLPLDRVKSYLALFSASDFLLEFFEEHDLPLRVAAEFTRLEKATNEVEARRIAKRYQDTPLTRRQLAAIRKAKEVRAGSADEGKGPAEARRSPRVAGRVEAAFLRDAKATLEELQPVLAKLGYQLVPTVPDPAVCSTAPVAPANCSAVANATATGTAPAAKMPKGVGNVERVPGAHS